MKILFFTILILAIIKGEQSAQVATANIHVDSTQIGIGTMVFHQEQPNTPVRIFGLIDGLKANTVHGLHVHQNPLPEGEYNCTAAGPHFNAYDTLHGPRMVNLHERHVGDLGNVTANENGIIFVEINDFIIDLYNATRSIANRTIVLHAIRDDGGSGGFPDSNTTGNAGPRIACGVISLSSEEKSATSNPLHISPSISDFFRQIFP